jgi:VanZ family protein
MRFFIKYHLPAILYGLLIIIISSIPYLGKPEFGLLKFDKVIHFIEYAVFAVLIFRSFSNISFLPSRRYVLWLSLFFLALFALFDEYYQSYIPGRNPDIIDLVFDICGATLIIILLYIKRKNALKEKAVT